MYPDLLTIGPVVIHSYGLMIAIGILAAVYVGMKRAKLRDLSQDVVTDVAIYGVIGGIVGAKLLYLIVEIPYIIKNPAVLKDMLASGFVVYGGIIGGVLAGYIYCRIKKVRFIEYLDLLVPSISIAQGFGRVGCFFAGCCYGRETTGLFGVTFNNSPLVEAGIRRVPTQIYSSIGNFMIAAILLAFASKPRKDGQVAGLYMMLYSTGRFIIEFFRDDPRGSILGLSTSQFICIFILIGGILVFNLNRFRKVDAQVE